MHLGSRISPARPRLPPGTAARCTVATTIDAAGCSHAFRAPAYFFFGEISQKTDFVRPEADILSQIPRFSVDEFSKEDEKYG
jgi:hypothetical protein